MTGGTRVICADELKPCELSWTTLGEIMIRSSASEMSYQETFDAFMQIDELFGKDYKTITRPFSMYGPFDGSHDVLFDDQTVKLRDKLYMQRVEKDIPSYDKVMNDVSTCIPPAGAGTTLRSSSLTAVFSIYVIIKILLL